MPRTTILAAFLTGLWATGSAQVITMDNVIPPPGTYPVVYAHIGDAPGPVDTVGTGLTWDISTGYSWDSEHPFTYTVGPASASPYAEHAPGANWHMEDQLTGEPYAQFFYRLDVDSLIQLGVLADYPGFPTELEPACEGLLMAFPATIGTEMVLGVPDWCASIPEVDHVARRVMATGQLVTALGTFTDVVLICTIRCGQGFVDPETGGSEHFCHKEFAWYQLGNLLYPLLQMYNVGSSAHLVGGVVFLPMSGTGMDPVDAAGISLFPNPATDRLHVQGAAGRPIGALSILGADGRVVRSLRNISTDRITVDVQDLSPGVYTVAFAGAHGMSGRRFVKQ